MSDTQLHGRVASDQDWTRAELCAALKQEFAPAFADAITDLEAFNTEPLV